jgi:anti-sigma regulatory factor (Ser/Thr protein kinase)
MPAPPDTAATFSFDDRRLRGCRAFVERHAARARLGVERSAEFAVAVNEIATNSVVHGGGSGTLRTWQDGRDLICEVADNGMITDPLEGRRRPRPDATHGRGLWLANHLCDLVQVRSGPAGVRVRLQVNLG